jgi:acetate kinase
MTSWSIQPEGVVAVLQDVNIDAEALGAALNGLSPALEGAVTATQSGAISEAVQSYFSTEEGPRIQGMSDRITASTSGVVSATEAYIAGDMEMAANAQTAAYSVVYPPALPRGVV